jgi:hypothetical protein
VIERDDAGRYVLSVTGRAAFAAVLERAGIGIVK